MIPILIVVVMCVFMVVLFLKEDHVTMGLVIWLLTSKKTEDAKADAPPPFVFNTSLSNEVDTNTAVKVGAPTEEDPEAAPTKATTPKTTKPVDPPIKGQYVRVQITRHKDNVEDYLNLRCIQAKWKGNRIIVVGGAVVPLHQSAFPWTNMIEDDDKYAIAGLSATAYAEIDLGAERDIDEIYIRNRGEYTIRITTTTLKVLDSLKNPVWTMDITIDRDKYIFPVSNSTNGKPIADVLKTA